MAEASSALLGLLPSLDGELPKSMKHRAVCVAAAVIGLATLIGAHVHFSKLTTKETTIEVKPIPNDEYTCINLPDALPFPFPQRTAGLLTMSGPAPSEPNIALSNVARGMINTFEQSYQLARHQLAYDSLTLPLALSSRPSLFMEGVEDPTYFATTRACLQAMSAPSVCPDPNDSSFRLQGGIFSLQNGQPSFTRGTKVELCRVAGRLPNSTAYVFDLRFPPEANLSSFACTSSANCAIVSGDVGQQFNRTTECRLAFDSLCAQTQADPVIMLGLQEATAEYCAHFDALSPQSCTRFVKKPPLEVITLAWSLASNVVGVILAGWAIWVRCSPRCRHSTSEIMPNDTTKKSLSAIEGSEGKMQGLFALNEPFGFDGSQAAA